MCHDRDVAAGAKLSGPPRGSRARRPSAWADSRRLRAACLIADPNQPNVERVPTLPTLATKDPNARAFARGRQALAEAVEGDSGSRWSRRGSPNVLVEDFELAQDRRASLGIELVIEAAPQLEVSLLERPQPAEIEPLARCPI